MFSDFQTQYIDDLVKALHLLDADKLEKMCSRIDQARRDGRTVFLMGNGGSSATPSHTAGDWAKVLRIRSLSLTDNTPFVTATSNDENYSEIFCDQLRVYMEPNDLVIGYSGSGNSANVVKAMEYAQSNDGYSIAVTGDYKKGGGGRIAKLADLAIVVKSESMERIEDIHVIINHIIKEYLRTTSAGKREQ